MSIIWGTVFVASAIPAACAIPTAFAARAAHGKWTDGHYSHVGIGSRGGTDGMGGSGSKNSYLDIYGDNLLTANDNILLCIYKVYWNSDLKSKRDTKIWRIVFFIGPRNMVEHLTPVIQELWKSCII